MKRTTTMATVLAAFLLLLAGPAGAVPLPMPDGGDGPSGGLNGGGIVIVDGDPGSSTSGNASSCQILY